MKKILAELKAIALARPLDCLLWDGNTLELKPLVKIPKKSLAGIARIERNASGVKVIFHDKLKAIELLLKYENPSATAEENNLLEAILEATKGDLDLTEIQEMGGLYENGISLE